MISFRPVEDVSQLVDALTGAALREGASKCNYCGVHYNRESVVELVDSNNGKCVSCEQALDHGSR